ncbi:SDR family oxidoreductase [Streptomyces sp. NPDC005900]|uniref:SDR family NAD(P)-dependent oxidoreductase n=1 Tax=Streptomyces sp. NPDC005900 TaxID=3154569 RepID=UPI0033F1A20A
MTVEACRPLEGRVALVTGGSRGIGADITRKLASWGATLCVNYVDHELPAKELLAELSAAGAEITLHQADLSDPADIENLMDEINRAHGRLNILVQNAAAAKFGPLQDMTLDHWAFTMDTNARATWLLAKHAIPLMRNQPGARFISITNNTTVRCDRKSGLFGAAKAALESLTTYLSYELAPHGIVANCVRPGLVETAVFDVRPELVGLMRYERERSPWPEQAVTTTHNSADAVALLCLDEATWIAGQTITVDGGAGSRVAVLHDTRPGE